MVVGEISQSILKGTSLAEAYSKRWHLSRYRIMISDAMLSY